MNRHIRTLDAIKEDQLETLKTKTVVLVGAGGLGGYVLEMLTRIGAGKIVVVDKDVLEESNLNRQILSTEQNMGIKKVTEAKERVYLVNSCVDFVGIKEELNAENAEGILQGADIVLDCVDNIKARYAMQDACEKLNIPLIHGAVGAWQGQVSAIFPRDRTISKIYGEKYTEELPPVGTASFLPAMIASYQVAECVKVLLDTGHVLRNKVMIFDMLNNQSFVVDADDFSGDI